MGGETGDWRWGGPGDERNEPLTEEQVAET